MDIESGHEEVYKPLTTKKHAPPESRASRRYALFLTATKVLCLLMVLSLLGYYVYVTVTMDDATAQLVRDVSKLQKQHNHHQQHRNKTSNDDVPEWFTQVLNLTRKGFVHISLQPFPPEAPEPTTHRRPTTSTTTTPATTTTSTTTTPTTTTSTTTTPTTTTTVEPPTTSSTTTSTTESTPEDSTTESTTTTTETIDHDYTL